MVVKNLSAVGFCMSGAIKNILIVISSAVYFAIPLPPKQVTRSEAQRIDLRILDSGSSQNGIL